MKAKLAALWAGRTPLAEAVWTYAVFWGLLVNLAATLASMAILVAGGGAPDPAIAGLSVVVHLLPLPYNVLVLVGVWRSAGLPGTGAGTAALARAFAVAWTVAMLLV